MPDGESFTVGIERLHLEQDAGKSIHDQHPTLSYVDLNRSGVALMEIVSKPDLRSAEQAQAFLTKLRSILRYLGTCDGDMEKGSLRADVNVSVRKPGGPLGTRCEIKNMNSIRFIGEAIGYEARRQIDIIEEGGSIDQETRLFDPNKGETRPMRSKEEAHDYRYFPDPDLLPLEFDSAYVEALKEHLPELPDDKKARFRKDYALSPYDADVLVAERASAEYFETVAKGRDAKAAANWVINELFGRLNKEGKDIASSPVDAAQLGAVLDLMGEGTISGKIAKDLFEIVWAEGGDPRQIVEQRGMKQVTDLGAIEKVIDDIIAKNPDKVADAKSNPQSDRLVRRTGDESVGRQGQSAGRERSAEEETRALKRAVRVMTRAPFTIGVLENVRRWRAQVPLSVSIMRASDARGSESATPDSLVFDRFRSRDGACKHACAKKIRRRWIGHSTCRFEAIEAVCKTFLLRPRDEERVLWRLKKLETIWVCAKRCFLRGAHSMLARRCEVRPR